MLLTGFPSLTYNPITKNPFHANFKVDTNSLYINYVLNEDARSKIESYIDQSKATRFHRHNDLADKLTSHL